MQPQDSAYVLALLSATLFSGASVIFAQFAKSHSSLWMNLMKNLTAGAAFVVAAGLSVLLTEERFRDISLASVGLLVASGFVGLAVGDYFLFRGFQRIGSARTIMVFSFSPVFLCIEGFLFFGQKLNQGQALAISLMMACMWVISFEKFRAQGSWEWKGLLFAFTGVLLDNIGIVLSRGAFDRSPEMSAFTANAVRSIGAILPLLVVNYFGGFKVFREYRLLPWKDRALVFFSAFMGTFLSLTAWLTAIKIGHIGSLAGVSSFNPVAASLWEWMLLRKRPTLYLIAALLLFLAGFGILLRS
jgi:drug/metabolite transporter (DMT)-like permease